MGLNSRQHLRVSTALLTCTHYTPRHAVQTHDMHIYARVRASVVVHTSYSKHCLDPVTAKWCRMTSVAAFLHVTHYTSWWSLAIISAESEQTGQVIAAHITWSGHAPIDPGCDAKRAVVSAQEMNAAQKRCWAFASWVQQKLCVPCMLVSINNKREIVQIFGGEALGFWGQMFASRSAWVSISFCLTFRPLMSGENHCHPIHMKTHHSKPQRGLEHDRNSQIKVI